MKRILSVAFMAVAFEAHAADIEVSIENFTKDGRILSAIMKVTNKTEQAVTNVYIDCAFLDKDKKAIDIGKSRVSRIEAKGYAYDKAAIVTDAKADFADCRVIDFDK